MSNTDEAVTKAVITLAEIAEYGHYDSDRIEASKVLVQHFALVDMGDHMGPWWFDWTNPDD